MINTKEFIEKNSLDDLDVVHVDLSRKSHQVADNAARQLITKNQAMYQLAYDRSDEIEKLQTDAKDKVVEYIKLRDLSEDRDYEDEDQSSDLENLSERINIVKEAANLAINRLQDRLEADGVLDWLNGVFGTDFIKNSLLISIDSRIRVSMTLKNLLNQDNFSGMLQGNPSYLFSGALSLYKEFGVTNIRPSLVNSGRLIEYLLLLELLKVSRAASKKANHILDKLRQLETNPVNMSNLRDIQLAYLYENYRQVTTELRDSLKNKKDAGDELLDPAGIIRGPAADRLLYGKKGIPLLDSSYLSRTSLNTPSMNGLTIGAIPERPILGTKNSFDNLLGTLYRGIDDLKGLDDYGQKSKYYSNLIERLEYRVIYGLHVDRRNKLVYGEYKVNGRNLLLLQMLGYDNFVKLLDYFINHEVDVHSFMDNITRGVYSNLHKESEQKAFFKYLKKLGKKNPAVIPSYMAFFGYKKAREAKNTVQLDAYIATVTESRRGHVSGKTGLNELLLERTEGNQLIFFTKEEGEITTIGNRTGCCFTPNGLAKSLLGIARRSHLAGILEGRHGSTRKSDWFSFVWELVEYNPKTQTLETALVLDNIESMNRIEPEDWKKIYEWLLKTPYNKVYLGYMRNDISSSIFKDTTDPTDLTDWHINPSTEKRSRQIIYYEKSFNSYSYDDSREVHTVIDRTSRAPRNLAVGRVTTDGEFHRVLYAEGLVWGDNSDYSVLRNLNYKQSPTYLTRDTLGNIYGYLITRLYKYNTETEIITYDDSFRVKPDEPLAENEELVLYLDDVFATRNISSLKALDLAVKNLLIYMETNNIKYVSAHFNSYSKKFLKRIEKHGFIYVPDTRFSDSGTTAELEPKPSLLLEGHPERLAAKDLTLDEDPIILYPLPPEEE